MSTKNKLLIIDTFYFLHRAFHAFPKEMKTSKGELTSIVFGFAQTLLNSISQLNPTHVVCAWESEDQPSFRKELYSKYQGNRVPGEPEDEKLFQDQIPRVIEIIEAFNIPRVFENGFEGDDVIGTVARRVSKESRVIVSTSDQDMLQLIDNNVYVFRPARAPYIKAELFDEKKFKQKYGFEPSQMIDYKSLRGDPSDNIPGVKGIGDKTAKSLIKQFGALDDIYANLDNIDSVAVRKKLEQGKADAYLSKQLATIITDIPIKFNLEACRVHDFDLDEVRILFEELEFKSLMRKLEKLGNIKDIKEKLSLKPLKTKKDIKKGVVKGQISLL